MKKNKAYFLNKLKETTSYDEKECLIISEILDKFFIIGHNNKEKIINEFVEKINIPVDEANKLYNICAEIIIKAIIKIR